MAKILFLALIITRNESLFIEIFEMQKGGWAQKNRGKNNGNLI